MVWLFLLPTFAAFCIGFLYPFFKGLFLSFCNFRITSQWTWTGLENYRKAFQDPGYMHAFWYTALFALVSLIVINLFAFTIAYALTQKFKGTNVFRTVFFLPNLIGGIVLGYIWSMIFDGILIIFPLVLPITKGGRGYQWPPQHNLLPVKLLFLLQYNTSVILETKYGFWGLVILMCWQQIGYMMIIYIAGLQAVPEDMLEAARIDGANRWQTLWRVTIPNVMPSITICMFLSLTNGFKLFDQNLALTAGRPFQQLGNGETIKTTEMLALNIVNAFGTSGGGNRGVGQAKAVIFFIVVAAISIIQLQASRRKEVQQ